MYYLFRIYQLQIKKQLNTEVQAKIFSNTIFWIIFCIIIEIRDELKQKINNKIHQSKMNQNQKKYCHNILQICFYQCNNRNFLSTISNFQRNNFTSE
ncbi:unnamed protein product [Paramecium primaurelia]|uniref:Uncharacterized protein n=1 Tax=Paramecium primaurelia TaxID=5886 RepID=A0A8S1LYB8_PARPR|nr:unnamed protein product [Paramecium primaurelia]